MAAALCASLLAWSLAISPTPSRADQTIDDLQQQVQNDQTTLAQINAQLAALNGQIGDLQGRIGKLRSILAGLSSRMATTQTEIGTEQARLDQLQTEEDALTARLEENGRELAEEQGKLNRNVRALDSFEQTPVLALLITSQSFSQFFTRLSDMQEIIDTNHRLAVHLRALHDQMSADRDRLEQDRAQQAQVVDTLQKQEDLLGGEYQAQNAALAQIAGAEAVLQGKQQQLDSQSQDLNDQIAIDQSEIQQLLAFSQGRIGSGGDILAPEILSDGWGTYYNQRDARWGDDYVGSSPYLVWEIGCLISSLAMVHSHFGDNRTTPAAIAMNPGNFDSGGDMYFTTLDMPGHPASIQNRPSRDWIASFVNGGGAVIIGMYIGTGGTHFVVVTGLRGGYDYWINDPWEPDAMHVSYDSSPVTGPIFIGVGYH